MPFIVFYNGDSEEFVPPIVDKILESFEDVYRYIYHLSENIIDREKYTSRYVPRMSKFFNVLLLWSIKEQREFLSTPKEAFIYDEDYFDEHLQTPFVQYVSYN